MFFQQENQTLGELMIDSMQPPPPTVHPPSHKVARKYWKYRQKIESLYNVRYHVVEMQ